MAAGSRFEQVDARLGAGGSEGFSEQNQRAMGARNCRGRSQPGTYCSRGREPTTTRFSASVAALSRKFSIARSLMRSSQSATRPIPREPSRVRTLPARRCGAPVLRNGPASRTLATASRTSSIIRLTAKAVRGNRCTADRSCGLRRQSEPMVRQACGQFRQRKSCRPCQHVTPALSSCCPGCPRCAIPRWPLQYPRRATIPRDADQ